jgi:hypothetical protein
MLTQCRVIVVVAMKFLKVKQSVTGSESNSDYIPGIVEIPLSTLSALNIEHCNTPMATVRMNSHAMCPLLLLTTDANADR